MESFPILSRGQDETLYSESSENPAIGSGMEGGYQITRARFTRAPRKTYQTGFTNISHDDKVLLENFWELMKGGAEAFQWPDPIYGINRVVRFEMEQTLEFDYAGFGHRLRWNISNIALVEV